jgi:hypothetical protein
VLGEIFDFGAPGKFCDFVPVLHIDRVQNLVGRLKRIMAPLEFRMGRKYLLMATLQSGVTRLQVRKGGRGHISSWDFKAQQGEIGVFPMAGTQCPRRVIDWFSSPARMAT